MTTQGKTLEGISVVDLAGKFVEKSYFKTILSLILRFLIKDVYFSQCGRLDVQDTHGISSREGLFPGLWAAASFLRAHVVENELSSSCNKGTCNKTTLGAPPLQPHLIITFQGSTSKHHITSGLRASACEHGRGGTQFSLQQQR